MKVSVVMVSWNVAPLLAACLRSLPAAAGDLDCETIVVDNGSTDGSAGMVAEGFPDVRLVCNAGNPGYAAANNQGLRLATGEHILLLNPDTVTLPGSLARLVAFMDGHPAVGACAPRLLQSDGRPQPYAFGCDPALPYLLHRGANRLIWRRPLHDWDAGETIAVDWVSGACLLLRAAALAQVGGLDEGFFMYFEDNDLCRRLRDAGWAVYYHPGVAITHLGGAGLRQNPAAARAYQASLRYFYRKYYGLAPRLLLAGALAVYNVLRRSPGSRRGQEDAPCGR